MLSLVASLGCVVFVVMSQDENQVDNPQPWEERLNAQDVRLQILNQTVTTMTSSTNRRLENLEQQAEEQTARLQRLPTDQDALFKKYMEELTSRMEQNFSQMRSDTQTRFEQERVENQRRWDNYGGWSQMIEERLRPKSPPPRRNLQSGVPTSRYS